MKRLRIWRRSLPAPTMVAIFAAAWGAAICAAGLGAQTTLRIVAYNIHHGEGLDGVLDLERIADVLRPLDADVVTLQEIDVGVERTGRVDQATRLGALLGMEAHFGPFMPYQGGEYGMAVLTRLPVLGVDNLRLPDGEEPRTALEVRVPVAAGREVSIVGIHFYRTPEERLSQAESVSTHFDDVERPVVLAGDFNSRRGDRVLASLVEAGWLVLDKSGAPETFPADAPEREIDFVMLRPGSAFEVVEHRVLDETVASDHRGLSVVLRIW